MTAPNRTYTQVGENGYAQAEEVYMTGNVRGPGAPATYVDGNPNGSVNGTLGQLAIDRATGDVYQNTDGDLAWSIFAGGGGAAVVTAAPLVGNGTGGNPVTYEDVLGQCFIGNPDEAVLAKPTALTTAIAGGMLANKVSVTVDPNYGSGTGKTGDPIKVLGEYLGRQVFTASGAYVANPLARVVVATVVAGGGGGGGADATGAGNVSAGGGGGSGVTLQKSFVSGTGSIVGGAVVIGAGGAGGAGASPGNNGAAGGDSSVVINGTTYTAKGGGGGAGGAVIAAGTGITGGGAAGSSGGSTLAADFRHSNPGGWGIGVVAVTEQGGNGGSSLVGEAGKGGLGNTPGGAAGKGGGGGGAGAGGVIQAGGNGGTGLVYIDEYT